MKPATVSEAFIVRLRRVISLRSPREGAALGRWLMFFTALVYAATGWYVDDASVHRSDLWVPFVVLVALSVIGISRVVRWDDLTPRATLVFPITGFGLVGLVGYLAPAAGPAYVSMFTLWFLFIGVTQSPGMGWVFVVPAGVVWLQVSGTFNERTAVRLVLAMIVWGLVADMLALRERVVERRNESLEQQAHTDPLTGLANRRSLERALDTLRPGDDVILLDLDHFKQVNDTRGHEAGDLILVDFARTLSGAVRGGDLVARFGGEEFVLILRRPDQRTFPAAVPQTDAGPGSPYVLSGALARLRTRWGALHPDITWSGGLCPHSPDRSGSQTLALADKALYEAKQAGRDRVVVSGGVLPDPVSAT